MKRIVTADATLQDGLVIQAVSKRRCHQLTDRLSACAFAKYGDIVWIAAEARNIHLNPAECCDLVQQAVIAGCSGFFGQGRVRHVAEWSEPVVDCDQNDAFIHKAICLVI